jgi:hypothetical protein
MFDYDLSYAQTAEFDPVYSSAEQRGIASGELQYLNGSGRAPLNLTYSGGYIIGISGTEEATGFFQHLLVSQGYATLHGSASLKDEFGLYPSSPTTGFSGVPGAGGIPGLPSEPDEPILTLNTLRYTNTVTADFDHTLTNSTTGDFTANYETMRFPNGGGLDINQVGARPHVTWRLDALNSATVQYNFSRFNYLGSPFTMETQTVEPGYTRIWNRRFTTNVSAGPEWLQSDNAAVVPSTLGIAANASAVYTLRSGSASIFYYRSVTAGAGLETQIGVRNNDITADFTKTLSRGLILGASGSYRRSQGFLQTGMTNGAFAGVNLSRHFGEYFVMSVNYTVIHQTSSMDLPAGALLGTAQEIGFNIAYHPHKTHIIRK